jgi:hypothetical protein
MTLARPAAWLLAALSFLSASEAFAVPGECPEPFPLAEVEVGMEGQAWTVAHGQTPEPFHVEVLGVLRDGITLGRDLIIVEIADEPGSTMIEDAGGVWAGMSGSPVYIGDRLLGAIAYSFGLGPTPVGGVTPAEDMLEVLAIEDDSILSASDLSITIPPSLRPLVAARAGLSERDVASMEPLPVSFGFSGLGPQRRELVQTALDRAGFSTIVTLASSVPRQEGPITARPVPGGNFAGMLAIGDLSSGGVGTTTYVCGDRALAFGHRLRLLGSTTLIANDAEAITIIPDPTTRPFKMANFGSLFGVLDEDRTAAIAATLGEQPPLVRIESLVEAPDLERERMGVSWTSATQFVPDVAALHLLANLDAVFDEVGDGRSVVRWRARGRRANGDEWVLGRSNRYASRFDAAGGSILEVLNQLARIETNAFEEVTFTRVKLKARVSTDFRIYRIESFTILKGGVPISDESDVEIHAGDELVLDVVMRAQDGALVTANLTFRVPVEAEGRAAITVFGGSAGPEFSDDCLFNHDDCPGESVDSFQDLLDDLTSSPQNNDLSAAFRLLGGDEDTPTIGVSRRFARVVDGSLQQIVEVLPAASADAAIGR